MSWSESLHPRDAVGRFANKAGALARRGLNAAGAMARAGIQAAGRYVGREAKGRYHEFRSSRVKASSYREYAQKARQFGVKSPGVFGQVHKNEKLEQIAQANRREHIKTIKRAAKIGLAQVRHEMNQRARNSGHAQQGQYRPAPKPQNPHGSHNGNKAVLALRNHDTGGKPYGS